MKRIRRIDPLSNLSIFSRTLFSSDFKGEESNSVNGIELIIFGQQFRKDSSLKKGGLKIFYFNNGHNRISQKGNRLN